MRHKSVWGAAFLGVALAIAVLFLCQRWCQMVEAAPGEILTVCPGGGCSYSTVQDAVREAENGDIIKVAEGVYTGVQDFGGGIVALVHVNENKQLTIRGGYAVGSWNDSDPDAHPTILDAEGQGRVLVIDGVAQGIVIDGIHIVGGDAREVSEGVWGGGGYFYNNSNVTLYRSVISGNTANYGGGVFVHGSTVDFIRCHIVANTAITYGGGIVFFISDSTNVFSSTIAGNHAQSGAGLYLNNSDTTMINNFLVDNHGSEAGGIYIEGVAGGEFARPRLFHTTIAGNEGESGIKVGLNSDVEMVNTIIADHLVGLDVVSDGVVSLASTLWHNNGTNFGQRNNVSHRDGKDGDPAFVDPGSGDYHIQVESAARDSGVAAGVSVDVDGDERPRGGGYDIGADEFPDTLGVSLMATPAAVRPGQRLTYVIQLSNFETMTLVADITNTLPAQVQPTGVVTWTSQDIAPGKMTWKQQIPVTVSSECQGMFVDEVEVATEGGDRFRRSLSLGCFTIYLPVVIRT